MKGGHTCSFSMVLREERGRGEGQIYLLNFSEYFIIPPPSLLPLPFLLYNTEIRKEKKREARDNKVIYLKFIKYKKRIKKDEVKSSSEVIYCPCNTLSASIIICIISESGKGCGEGRTREGNDGDERG